MSEPNSNTFIYKERKVSYTLTGSGKNCVILHGWGSNKKVMMPVAKGLEDVRKCYVMDLPGFGESEEPAVGWDINDYAAMVKSFIEEKNLAPVDIVAHSFGGRITLKLCADEFGKNKIEKVLLTGGAGMKPRRSLQFYIKKYTAKTLKAPFIILPKSLREPSLQWLRNTPVWKKLGSSDYSKLSGVMRETFVKSVTEHLDHLLGSISHDCLLLWGRNDDATPLYQAERMEKGLKNAALVIIEDAGHYAFLDKPKQFVRIAKAFLEG